MGSPPVATERPNPAGIMLENGYQTLVTISSDTDISFWEKTVTPPGLDGGDEIDQTTMHNLVYSTSAPRTLKTMTEMSLTASYDPNVYTQLLEVVDLKTTITVTYPDGSTLAFYGFVKNAEPNEMVEGTQPEMTVTIMPTNADPSDGSEQAAFYSEELIVNGDFATGDLTGWTNDSLGTGSAVYEAGAARLTAGNDAGIILQTAAIPLVVGETYVLSADVTGDDVIYTLVDNSESGTWSAGSNSVTFVASADSETGLSFGSYAPSGTSTIDNISLKRES